MAQNAFKDSWISNYEDFHLVWSRMVNREKWAWSRDIPVDKLFFQNRHGDSVAHTLAEQGYLPETGKIRDVFKISNRKGWTVAHALAHALAPVPQGLLVRDIVLLGDENGTLVAHGLARTKQLPEEFITPDLLFKRNREGFSIMAILIQEHRCPFACLTPEILAAHITMDPALTMRRNTEKQVADRIVSDLRDGRYGNTRSTIRRHLEKASTDSLTVLHKTLSRKRKELPLDGEIKSVISSICTDRSMQDVVEDISAGWAEPDNGADSLYEAECGR